MRLQIQTALSERESMLNWIRQAQSIAPYLFIVTERDFDLFGHLPPKEWLGSEFNDLLSEEDMLEDSFYNDEPEEGFDYEERYSLEYDEEFDWEPCELKFAGRMYPAADVIAARNYLHGERNEN